MGIGIKDFSQFSVDDSPAVELAPERQSRVSMTIYNAGTDVAYLGRDNTVASVSGFALAAGATLSDDSSRDAWWAICATGDATDLRVIEVL